MCNGQPVRGQRILGEFGWTSRGRIPRFAASTLHRALLHNAWMSWSMGGWECRRPNPRRRCSHQPTDREHPQPWSTRMSPEVSTVEPVVVTPSPFRGWLVTAAGTGINLALGVLYTWSL